MRTTPSVAIAMLVMTMIVPARPAELRDTTLESWQRYVRDANLRMQARVSADGPFLWVDEDPDRKVRVRRGEIVVAPALERGTKSIPSGLIHDWAGAVFVPQATIASLKDVLRDYDRYREIYQPVVKKSDALVSSEAAQEFAMTWQRHVLGVNAAIEAQYRARDFLVDSRTGYSLVDATRVQQIEAYGRPSEHRLEPDRGSGFIWRLYSIIRYKQTDDGVYLEIEALVLSRDIPASFRFIVSPIVDKLSVNSLSTTLRQTREAVSARSSAEARLVTVRR